jgi:heme/copper-type cytochrome/quinol oxidase subunit 1
MVIGLGIGIFFFGQWATTRGEASGWVAYAPLSNSSTVGVGGLDPWVRLVIWLALTLAWTLTSIALLHGRPDAGGSGSN